MTEQTPLYHTVWAKPYLYAAPNGGYFFLVGKKVFLLPNEKIKQRLRVLNIILYTMCILLTIPLLTWLSIYIDSFNNIDNFFYVHYWQFFLLSAFLACAFYGSVCLLQYGKNKIIHAMLKPYKQCELHTDDAKQYRDIAQVLYAQIYHRLTISSHKVLHGGFFLNKDEADAIKPRNNNAVIIFLILNCVPVEVRRFIGDILVKYLNMPNYITLYLLFTPSILCMIIVLWDSIASYKYGILMQRLRKNGTPARWEDIRENVSTLTVLSQQMRAQSARKVSFVLMFLLTIVCMIFFYQMNNYSSENMHHKFVPLGLIFVYIMGFVCVLIHNIRNTVCNIQ